MPAAWLTLTLLCLPPQELLRIKSYWRLIGQKDRASSKRRLSLGGSSAHQVTHGCGQNTGHTPTHVPAKRTARYLSRLPHIAAKACT